MSEDSQKVTVDKTKTGDKTKTSDKTKTGNKTKTSDKTKTGNKTKTSDKTETDNNTKTSDKTKTGGKTLTVIVGPKIAGKKRKYPKKFIVKDTDYAATLVKSSEPLTIPLSKKPKVTIQLAGGGVLLPIIYPLSKISRSKLFMMRIWFYTMNNIISSLKTKEVGDYGLFLF